MKFSVKKLLVYLIVLVLACVGAVFGYISYTKSKTEVVTALYTISEPLNINLKKDSEGTKVLRTKLTLEYQGKKGEEVLIAELSRINDTIINVFSNKTNSELTADTNKEKLKKELVKALNKTLEQEIIIDILFNEFITS